VVTAHDGRNTNEFQGTNVSEKLANPPHIAINTTVGTGSETTPFYVITDTTSENAPHKWVGFDQATTTTLAINDPVLMMTQPPQLVAYTGFDTLAHATECYTNRVAMPSVMPEALRAAQMVEENLREAVGNPHNEKAMTAMCWAQYMAAQAFSSGLLGILHSLSQQRPAAGGGGARGHRPARPPGRVAHPRAALELVARGLRHAPIRAGVRLRRGGENHRRPWPSGGGTDAGGQRRGGAERALTSVELERIRELDVPGRPEPSRPRARSARAAERRDGELAADRAGGASRDLAMARDRGTQIQYGVRPDRVVGALAQRLAAAVAQMTLKLAALQAAGSMVICSTCPKPIGGSRPSAW